MGKHTGKGLKNIADYPSEQRQDYLLLIAAVAASDGAIHPDEMNLLSSWMDSFKLSDASREVILANIHKPATDLEQLEKKLARTELVFSLMLDMMGMAMADGVLMDDEIYMLRDVAENLNLSARDFDILIEFVHSAHQASMLSNPEPLYEHNIQSAFQLMRKRKVQLFPHTLLCPTSATFDKELKERWAGYQAKK